MRALPFLDNIDPGQGGSAMVIPEYNWYKENQKPVPFPCQHCSEVFSTYEQWFEHRFHTHPIKRPSLVIGRDEIVTPRWTVMKTLAKSDIRTVNALTCRVNGKDIPIGSLANKLTDCTQGFFDVRLVGDGHVEARYEIVVQIPDAEHVQWVERDFGRLAMNGDLSVHAVNSFIQATMTALTARQYVDGLANYLFGLLGKDQRGNTGLTQEQGRSKLNEALQTLRLVDRPLAHVVCAIIEFQLNSFARTERLDAVPRLQRAMNWFEGVRLAEPMLPDAVQDSNVASLARVPLDAATDEILTWMNASEETLLSQSKLIERRAKQPDWLPEDRVKALVLYSVILSQKVGAKPAAKSARGFRHDPVFQDLAERLIAANGEEQ